MAIDKSIAERRRFARLLGMDGEPGSGLPIGIDADPTAETDDERGDA